MARKHNANFNKPLIIRILMKFARVPRCFFQFFGRALYCGYLLRSTGRSAPGRAAFP